LFAEIHLTMPPSLAREGFLTVLFALFKTFRSGKLLDKL